MATHLEGSSYLLGASLGRGTLGPSFEATHTTIGHEVVVELVAWTDVPVAAIETTMMEARTIARIDSEHLAKVLEVERLGEGRVVAARESAPGWRLDRLIAKRGKLSVTDTIDVLLQILPVLAAAHGLGVMHRGLEERSVWIESANETIGTARLADFGAIALMPLGERPPLAPEMVAGELYDQRVDVFGVGRIAYAMLSGTARREDDAASRLSQVPAPIARVIDRCLWHQPEERIGSIHELIEHLQEAREAAGLSDVPSRPRESMSGERRAERARLLEVTLGEVDIDLALDSSPPDPSEHHATVLWNASPVPATKKRRTWALPAAALALAVGSSAYILTSSSADPAADPVAGGAEAATVGRPLPLVGAGSGGRDEAWAGDAADSPDTPRGVEVLPEPDAPSLERHDGETDGDAHGDPALAGFDTDSDALVLDEEETGASTEPESGDHDGADEADATDDPDDAEVAEDTEDAEDAEAARREEAFRLAQLGTNAMKNRDAEKGREYFEAALRRNPRLAYAHDGLSQYYFDKSQFSQALKHARRAAGISPNTAKFRVHYGDALYRSGDKKNALREYKNAKRLGARNVDRRIERAGGTP